MPPKTQPKSGLPPPSFVCSSCSKSYGSRDALEHHRRDAHHLISCTYSLCLRSFIDQVALGQHLASAVHKKSPEKRSQGQPTTTQAHPTVVQRLPSAALRQSKAAQTPRKPIKEHPKAIQSQSRPTQSEKKEPQMADLAISCSTRLMKLSSVNTASHDGSNLQTTRSQVNSSLTPAKPICISCNQNFPNVSGLRNHLDSTGHTSKYACKACNRSFGDEKALEMHLGATKHSSPVSNPEPEPTIATLFACMICDTCFEDVYILQQHLIGHLSHWESRDSGSADTGLLLSSSALQSHHWNTGDATRPSNYNTSTGPLSGTELPLQEFWLPNQRDLQPCPVNETATLPTTGDSSLKPEGHLQTPVITIPQVLSGAPSVPKLEVMTAKQPPARWTTIPLCKSTSSIIALAKRCHSYDILVKNNYFKGPTYKEIPLGVKPPPLRDVRVAMSTPDRNPRLRKRSAVALDCEMVGVVGKGASEVVRISAVDYLTGEILIDTLVKPMRRVTSWRTRFSGVNSKMMNAAVAAGHALNGWPEAREQLWKFVDGSTILIGQALYHDLEVLGIRHERIVDSAILAREAVGYDFNKQWGLKALCKQFLGIEIQNSGKKGHDSVEDANAAREVVLWCIGNEEELKAWGAKNWEVLEKGRLQKLEKEQLRKLEKEKKWNEKRLRRMRQAALCSSGPSSDNEYGFLSDDFDIGEYLVDCGWPHPDTGYSPWSD